MIYVSHYSSPLGGITMAGDKTALTGLWFDGQKYFGATLPAQYAEEELPIFCETKRWLEIYFQGKDPAFLPPISFSATPFQKTVWEILRTIPYGQTMTYGEIARLVAKRNGLSTLSAQAVGGAVGRNPVSILIPCHRVVGANGSLTGYAGGIDKKIGLLTLEHADVGHLFVPKKGTAL